MLIMEVLMKIISNRIIISCFLAWLVAELIQFIGYYLKNKKFSLESVFKTGGFPSRHSAGVAALSSSLFFMENISSLFVVALVFSMVVVRDAFGRHTLKEILAGIALGLLASAIVFYV